MKYEKTGEDEITFTLQKGDMFYLEQAAYLGYKAFQEENTEWPHCRTEWDERATDKAFSFYQKIKKICEEIEKEEKK